MELIIVTIGIGLSLVLNVIAIAIFHRYVVTSVTIIHGINNILIDYIDSSLKIVVSHISDEHRDTRKETQEIKTRLTQVRKDLNVIEEKL